MIGQGWTHCAQLDAHTEHKIKLRRNQDTGRQPFVCSQSVLIMTLLLAGFTECCEEGCKKRQFGTASTDSAFHANKHCKSCHDPKLSKARAARPVSTFFQSTPNVRDVIAAITRSLEEHGMNTAGDYVAPSNAASIKMPLWLHSALGAISRDEPPETPVSALLPELTKMADVLNSVDGLKCSHQLQGVSRVSNPCVKAATEQGVHRSLVAWMSSWGKSGTAQRATPVQRPPTTLAATQDQTKQDWLSQLLANPPNTEVSLCSGYCTNFLEPFLQNYPIQLHSQVELPWEAPTSQSLHSKDCARFVASSEPGCCPACCGLEGNRKLGAVLERSLDDQLHARTLKNIYLTSAQLQARSEMHRKRWDMLRLKVYSMNSKIQKLLSVQSDVKRLIQLLSENDIKRLRHQLKLQVKAGASIKAVLKKLEKAIAGDYHPAGFGMDDLDYAELGLILGGARMVYAMSKKEGHASQSTVKRAHDRPRFFTSIRNLTQADVAKNLQSFFLRGHEQPKSLVHMMIDDVNIEARRRASPADGHVRGYGRESNFDAVSSTEVRSFSNLQELKQAEENGDLLLAQEMTVYALGRNARNGYALSLVGASGSAKKGASASHLLDGIESVVSAYRSGGDGIESSGWAKIGPVSTIQTDGASIMRSALHEYCTKFTMGPNSGVRQALGVLSLFDYSCGLSPDEPIVPGCDDKHVGKRFRMALKSISRSCKIGSYTFASHLLERLLLWFGYAKAEIKDMFAHGIADAQNVAAMLKLMRALGLLLHKPLNGYPDDLRSRPDFSDWLKAFQALALYCGLMYIVITQQDVVDESFLPLPLYLRKAGTLSLLAFSLFRENGTAFIPSQNYANTQAMCRAKFVSSAGCIAEGIKEYFPFLDSDDRLEGFFGMQRVLEAGSNFDAIQFEERAGELMRLDLIYERHPEWRKSSRRLVGRIHDHLNTRTLLASDTGSACCDVDNVILATCWQLACQDAAAAARGVVADEHTEYTTLGSLFTVLRPFGDWVGVCGAELDDDEPEQMPAPHDGDSDGEDIEFEDMLPTPEASVAAEAAVSHAAAPEAAFDEAPVSNAVAAQLPPVGVAVHRPVVSTLTDFPGYDRISVEHAIKLYFTKQGSKSSDRINRVMHKLKAGTHAFQDTDVECERAAGLQAEIDPILALVKVPAGISAVLATAVSFTGASGEKGLGSISLAELKGAKCTAYCRVLQAEFSPCPDTLVFGKGSVGEEFTTAGVCISQFNPVTRNDNGAIEWVVDVSEWSDAVEVLYAALSTAGRKPKLATLLQPRSTYSGLTGDAVCVATGTEDGHPSASALAASKEATVKCGICNMEWEADKIRHHIGAHVLTGDWGQIPIASRPRYPCGICGTREAGQYTPFPLSVTGCPVSLSKHNSTHKAVHQCKHVPVPTYSLASALKSNKSTPCTNAPIICRGCPPKPMPVVIYKHSMAHHWEDQHNGIVMDKATKADIALGVNELSWVTQLLRRKTCK